MLELTEAHHQVLYLAVDEANLQALMSRTYGHIGEREVTVLEPLDPETARAAALELLSAGHVNVFYRAALAGKDSQEDRENVLPPKVRRTFGGYP